MKRAGTRGRGSGIGECGSIAQRVREYLMSFGQELIDEPVKVIALACSIERDEVRFTLRDFLKRGEIEIVGAGYRYIGRKEEINKADRVWKAMRYVPVFTASEIAQIAKVDREYVLDIIKRYRKAGHILKSGSRKTARRKPVELYALTDRDLRERPILKAVKREG